jgi:hypothetical protein
MTHHRCRPPELKFDVAGGKVFHPENGVHYVVRSDGEGKVTVEEE